MKKQLQILSLAVLFSGVANAQSCDATVHSGDATYYIDAESAGANSAVFHCSFSNVNIKPYYGAMNTTLYANADECGVCVEATGTVGTKGTQIIETSSGSITNQ